MDIGDFIWVQSDKEIEVKVYVYIEPGAKQIQSLAKHPIDGLDELGLERHEVISYWTIPTRANMEEYRRSSASFNFQAGTVIVDEIILSDCVVSGHIRRLSVDGNEVELEHDSPRKLAIQSLDKLKSLHAGLYDILYDKYKMEACLF